MKRIAFLLACLLLVADATYLATTWCYRVGPFGENNVRDYALEARDAKQWAMVRESSAKAAGDNALEVRDGKQWAQPVNLPGVPNAFRVSEGLYRGAQPTAQGLANLRKLGIKTVINLREENVDAALANGADFKLVHIPLFALRTPTDQEVLKFLQTVSDPQNQPVFVHCRAGADRTGTMCAVYRVAVQGWDRQMALDEMTRGGFNFHWEYQNLVQYIRTTDFARFKQTATMPTASNDECRILKEPGL